jgi:hypothetical protein
MYTSHRHVQEEQTKNPITMTDNTSGNGEEANTINPLGGAPPLLRVGGHKNVTEHQPLLVGSYQKL